MAFILLFSRLLPTKQVILPPVMSCTEHLLCARSCVGTCHTEAISFWQQLEEATPHHPCLPDEETEAQRLSDDCRVSQLIIRELSGTPAVPESSEPKRTS